MTTPTSGDEFRGAGKRIRDRHRDLRSSVRQPDGHERRRCTEPPETVADSRRPSFLCPLAACIDLYHWQKLQFRFNPHERTVRNGSNQCDRYSCLAMLGWIREYQKDWLRLDIIAGLTAAAV